MKTLRIIKLALVAVVLSATLVACSDDEDEGGGSSGSTTIKTSTSVNVETPGTLKLLLGDKVQTITSLKVSGTINGDDIICLRQMLRCTDEDIDTRGMLTILDLSDVSIVSGGNTRVDYGLFTRCESLEEISLSKSRDVISGDDFAYCIGLKKVIIPDNVTTIEGSAFRECTDLTSVTIPKDVVSIGDYAFRGCSDLEMVNFNAAACNFAGSNWDRSIFIDCSNLSIACIGENVTIIPDFLFYKCLGIEEITIPNSVTSIGFYAFCACSSLTEVTIGNSVTSIGYGAFETCSSLTEITSLNPEPPVCNDVFYTIDKETCTLYVPKGSKDAYSTATEWKDFQNIVEIDT